MAGRPDLIRFSCLDVFTKGKLVKTLPAGFCRLFAFALFYLRCKSQGIPVVLVLLALVAQSQAGLNASNHTVLDMFFLSVWQVQRLLDTTGFLGLAPTFFLCSGK